MTLCYQIFLFCKLILDLKIMKIEEEINGRFRNESHKAVINIIYTGNYLNNKFFGLIKEFGLSTQQYNILKILRGFGEKQRSISFIKERMLDKSSDVSRIIDRLFVKGFVERCENENDRRQKSVSISKKGLDFLVKTDFAENYTDNLISNLTENEIEILNSLLDKLRD